VSFVDLPISHGLLEGFIWDVEAPRAAVVVCHPHPQHGGTMHNHVTYRIAQAFRDAGVSALRFNYRGVGRSTGTYDEGRGEVDDAEAALDFLRKRVGDNVPLYVAGFSFGSRVALRLAVRDSRVQKVMAVGIAVDLFDYDFARKLTKPKAFVHADRDEYGALANVEKFIGELPGPKKLFVVSECTHLAPGRLDAFLDVTREAVAWLQSA
jgi:alpha/beta superfamily hydrolase